MLATDAASEGLNLHTRCRLIINLELPWTPPRVEQRIGRVDRIGQTRTVHAVHLVARGTGEEHLLRRLSDRAARARVSLQMGVSRAAIASLHDDAAAEVVRLQHARALTSGRRSTQSRPALCVVHRRTRLTRERIWVWRLTYTDERGRLLWDSLLPVRAGGGSIDGSATSARQLGAVAQQVLAATACAPSVALHEATDAFRQHASVLLNRERAIADALRDRHARLASALLQPGLFDRRTDRAAAAQAALLADALSRAHARLRELAASGDPRVEECRLIFAVALQ
jgi:hypothetical protein